MSSITGTLNNGAGTGGVITNPIFSYDSNGNMLSETGTGSIGRTLTYTAFNVPATITNGTSTLAFTFDSRHKRIIQTAPEGTTVYLNGGGIKSEKFTATGTGVVTWRNYIVADGAIKLIYSQTGNTSGPNWGSSTWGSFTWTSSTTASMPLYLHQDHLGSVVAISGTSGSLIEQDAYDPWGKRRNLNGTDDTYDTLTSDTTRGYTGQEHLGDLALIHMNARVYDPQIGRFSGTDPMDGDTGGSWNRYAYVGGNPLNMTDPTGMEDEEPMLCVDACGQTSQSSSGDSFSVSSTSSSQSLSGSSTSWQEDWYAGTPGFTCIGNCLGYNVAAAANGGLISGSIYSVVLDGYSLGPNNDYAVWIKTIGFFYVPSNASSFLGGASGSPIAGGNGGGGSQSAQGGGGYYTTTDSVGDDGYVLTAAYHPIADQGGQFNVDLLLQEALGGHTIQEHVGKSFDYLKNRGLPFASSFSSLPAAQKLVNAVLSAHATDIDAVLDAGKKGVGAYASLFNSPTGYGLAQGGNALGPTYNVLVVISTPYPGAPNNFLVVTAYPF